MELSYTFEENVAILRLAGEFDLSETARVDAWFDQHMIDTPAKVVVNLENVTFIDSAGLSSLVYGMKQARQKEGDLYLCAIPADVHLIFELTRLDQVFAIFDEEHEAVKAFPKRISAF
jgi:anti-anti-sigma factor